MERKSSYPEKVVTGKNNEVIVNWEEFWHVLDCFLDEGVREHSDWADKAYPKVYDELVRKGIFRKPGFIGEAFEVAAVYPDPIKMSDLPPHMFIARFIENGKHGYTEYIAYRGYHAVGFFVDKKDAIACANAHKGAGLMEFTGEIQVRRVILHPKKIRYIHRPISIEIIPPVEWVEKEKKD